MTEAELQAAVEDMLVGSLWHHCDDPRRCSGPRGFPDVLALTPAGLLTAELKAENGIMSPGQRRWRYGLQSAGVRWALWQPVDLESGLIKASIGR